MSGREVKGLRHHRLAISVAVISAAATLVVAALPAIDFAYRRPSLRAALETAAMLIALLAAWLVLGRFLRSAALPDLVLVCALAALAGANLVSAAALAADSPSRFATWAPLAGRVLGSALFAAAALVPAVSLRRPRATAALALAAIGVTLTGVAVVVALAGTRLPVGVETRPAGDPGGPDLDGHPVVLGVQLVTMILFGAAALGFSARFAKTGDDLMRFLAVGAVFAVFARVNYFLYPSLYSTWLYVGDVFRLLFWLALLVGAAREIRSYWESATHAAVLDERRRIARELHDGAAQELAYLVRRLRGIAADDAAVFAPLVGAAERGLDESRRAIAALSRPVDEQLDTSLAEAVGQVAARTGVRLALNLATDVRVSPDVREGLIRIACEAVNNAANHSGASVVRVE
ncbi:MAG: histidine kinase, partial [Thermoleophilia bacterium]|nr:histidine kinase [Thermoleophilia bacterium]